LAMNIANKTEFKRVVHHRIQGGPRIVVKWSKDEEAFLEAGVERHGFKWTQILREYQFHPRRSSLDLKDKYRNLLRRRARLELPSDYIPTSMENISYPNSLAALAAMVRPFSASQAPGPEGSGTGSEDCRADAGATSPPTRRVVLLSENHHATSEPRPRNSQDHPDAAAAEQSQTLEAGGCCVASRSRPGRPEQLPHLSQWTRVASRAERSSGSDVSIGRMIGWSLRPGEPGAHQGQQVQSSESYQDRLDYDQHNWQRGSPCESYRSTPGPSLKCPSWWSPQAPTGSPSLSEAPTPYSIANASWGPCRVEYGLLGNAKHKHATIQANASDGRDLQEALAAVLQTTRAPSRIHYPLYDEFQTSRVPGSRYSMPSDGHSIHAQAGACGQKVSAGGYDIYVLPAGAPPPQQTRTQPYVRPMGFPGQSPYYRSWSSSWPQIPQ